MGEACRLRVHSSGSRFIKVSRRRVRMVASSARSFLFFLVLQRGDFPARARGVSREPSLFFHLFLFIYLYYFFIINDAMARTHLELFLAIRPFLYAF
jgi:hypothetical protein